MDALEIRRIETKVYAYNVLSINSLRRNGFQQEGVLRQAKTYGGERWDMIIFSILEDEMRAQRAQESFPYIGFWEPEDHPSASAPRGARPEPPAPLDRPRS